MIIEAANQLTERDFTLKQQIRDNRGIVGALLQKDEDWYCLVAKEYAYQNKASFIKQVADFSSEKGVKMVFYQNDSGDYTVFDPDTVATFGKDSVGDSKKGAAEWREIPLTYGISLDEHLSGVVPTLPGNQSQLVGF